MKLYCFDLNEDAPGDWPTESGTVIAENEAQAWELFRKAYIHERMPTTYFTPIEDLKALYDVIVHDLDKPMAWVPYCSN
ncbi:hypothetical protein [Lactobacillus xujianguonis]|uniref:hypothetical protein n=1 Tax=Lactobacillus xujianguonis TaxID=2495899 RepID=UPI000FD70A60|nr:hypothetical protein [Lactobacillus xujianguonis]RVU73663.1 hypothetical protein EJK20_07170 [Lactobacillus xujianguonis]